MKKLAFPKAFFLIFSSVLVISGPCYATFFFYRSYLWQKRKDPTYKIEAILQTSQGTKRLSTQYLAEKMGLSKEKSENIFLFQERKGEELLKSSPFIKGAIIKKMKPNTLYINYRLREPVATIFDLENILVDKEGFLFANIFQETVPEIYLDLEKPFCQEFSWQKPISGEKWDFAIKVLQEIQEILPPPFLIERVDVSQVFLSSYGKRELVLSLIEKKEIQKKGEKILCFFPKYLRLPVKGYKEQMLHFLSLNESMGKDYESQLLSLNQESASLYFSPKVVDLRIIDLAFLEKE